MENLTASLRTGMQTELTTMVTPEHLASRWGSGGVDVFATPHMIAIMEQATVRTVDHLLPDGHRTVGIHIDVRHLAATPMGHHVLVRSTLTEIKGRRLVFQVVAEDIGGTIGEGIVERYIVALPGFVADAAQRVAAEPMAAADAE